MCFGKYVSIALLVWCSISLVACMGFGLLCLWERKLKLAVIGLKGKKGSTISTLKSILPGQRSFPWTEKQITEEHSNYHLVLYRTGVSLKCCFMCEVLRCML